MYPNLSNRSDSMMTEQLLQVFKTMLLTSPELREHTGKLTVLETRKTKVSSRCPSYEEVIKLFLTEVFSCWLGNEPS